jgi:hypothetical protein
VHRPLCSLHPISFFLLYTYAERDEVARDWRVGEDFVVRNFVTCTLHQMLLC